MPVWEPPSRLGWVGLVLFCSCAVLPPAGELKIREIQFQMAGFQTAAGLRVVVEEDHSTPVVGVVAAVGAGSSNDPVGKEGLAHFVEHLTFLARQDDRSALGNLFSDTGAANMNAFTGLDETVWDVNLDTVQRMLGSALPVQLTERSAEHPPARRFLSTLPPEPPEPPPGRLERYPAAVSMPQLYLAWSLPRGVGAGAALHGFVAQILESHLSGLSAEDKDIVAASVGVVPGTQASMLVCEVTLKEGAHPEESLEHVLKRVDQAWKPGSMTQTFWRSLVFQQVKTQAVVNLGLEAESIAHRALARAESTQLTGDANAFSHNLQGLYDTSVEQLYGTGTMYLRRNRARAIFVSPFPGTAHPPETLAPVGDTVASRKVAKVRYPLEAIRAISHSPGVSLYQTLRLDNGLEVIIGRRPFWPFVTVALGLHGGKATAVPLGVGDMAMFASPSSHAHGYFGWYGVEARDEVSEDSVLFEAQAGSGNLPNLLAILSDRVDSMTASHLTQEQVQKLLLPPLQHLEATPNAQAERAFRQALFGDSVYGHRAGSQDLAQVSPSSVQKWLDAVYSPKNATLVVVGDVDPAQVADQVRSWLGGWKGAAPAAGFAYPLLPPRAPAGAPVKLVVTHRPGATQGELRLGCVLEARTPAQAVAHQLLAELISSGLDHTVRQGLGATYGFQASSAVLGGGVSRLSIRGDVDNANLTRVLAVLKRSWAGLGAERFDEQDVNRARWSLARQYNLRFLTSGALAEALVGVRMQGWDLSSLDTFPELLTEVSAESLQEAATACRRSAVLSVLGDEPTVRRALQSGWAPPE